MNFESVCEQVFSENGPFWHLCTPGDLSGILFKEKEDYVFGMNAVAVCAAEHADSVSIYTFQIMGNHLHFVLSGEETSVNEFFESLRRRFVRYFIAKYNTCDLKSAEYSVIPVENLKYLRTLIAYVNRNGYVVNRGDTPFSYRWGANGYFFNYLIYNEMRKMLLDCPIAFKRKLFRSRNFICPENFYLTDGYVSPLCYCRIALAEQLFYDAHQYFNYVSRQVESFASMAKELGDKIILTDDEMYSTILMVCKKEYNVEQPVQLNKDAKIRVAKLMHYDYNASNKQIRRILRLDDHVIESLFPQWSVINRD